MEIRLNKLISDSGICSRREADRLIEEGRVTINGKPARMGQKVTEQDAIRIDEVDLNPSKRLFNPDNARKQVQTEMPINKKSAALRKTSRNNPVNKAQRKAARNKVNKEEEYGSETHRTGNRRTTFRKK